MNLSDIDFKALGDQLKVDWKKIPLKQFEKGFKVEYKEHKDVHKGDILMAGRIAHSHLKEYADYYDRLEQMEKD